MEEAMANIEIKPDAQSVAIRAAELMAHDITNGVARFGSATWVAAGGGTPARAYDILVERHADVPWKNLLVLMGDERCVPIGDKDSNWQQLTARLLEHVPVSADNLMRPPAELGAKAASAKYAAQLERLPNERGRPRLDHVWLGMGEDGHTLSLFPGHAELNASGLVTAVRDSPKPPPDRVTLTLAALRGAAHCVILATGTGKHDAVSAALQRGSELPIARAARTIEGAGGKVVWLLDDDAAGDRQGIA
jgi:6-phosphogluconolactonase